MAVIDNGQVVAGAPTAIELVTIDFLATGGDNYPLHDLPRQYLPVTFQRAIADYLVKPWGLNGLVTAGAYPNPPLGGHPPGGWQRLVVVN